MKIDIYLQDFYHLSYCYVPYISHTIKMMVLYVASYPGFESSNQELTTQLQASI